MAICGFQCCHLIHLMCVCLYQILCYILLYFCCSVAKSSPVLWPHELQHARLPCPLLSPGVCSNPCPLTQWCHPTISSSATPFSSGPQSCPASGTFPMSWLFASGDQRIAASASTSIFPVNTAAVAAKSLQSCPTLCDPIDGSPPGSADPGILQARTLESEVAQSCPTLCNPVDCSLPGFSVHGILQARILEWVAISFSRGIFPTQGSNPGLLHWRQTLSMHESESEVSQSCPTLSDPMDCSPPGSSVHGIFQARVLEWDAIAFSVPRSKHLNFMATITICSNFGAQKDKVSHCSTVSPSVSHEVMGPDAMILVFWMLSFKPTFSLSSFTFIKRLLSSSSLSAIRVVSSAYLRLLIFLLAILIPAYALSSPAFLMMYFAYKLNKQGDTI